MATHEQLEDFDVWDPESGQSTTLAAGDDTDARTRPCSGTSRRWDGNISC